MIRSLLAKTLAVTFIAVAALFFSSCGTVAGLGEDVKRLGRKIESKSDGRGTFDGFGEDLQDLGRKMERKSDEVYYDESY